MLSCKSIEGHLKLPVLIDATPAELGFAAVAEQTAAVSAKNILGHIGKVVGGKLLLALDLVCVVLLNRCWLR